jgi:hypothetical protein
MEIVLPDSLLAPGNLRWFLDIKKCVHPCIPYISEPEKQSSSYHNPIFERTLLHPFLSINEEIILLI